MPSGGGQVKRTSDTTAMREKTTETYHASKNQSTPAELAALPYALNCYAYTNFTMRRTSSFEQRVADIDSDGGSFDFSAAEQHTPTFTIWDEAEGIIHNPGVEEAIKAGRVHVSPEEQAKARPVREPPCTCPEAREPWMKRQALFFQRLEEKEGNPNDGKGEQQKEKRELIYDDITYALKRYVGAHYAAQAVMDDYAMKYPQQGFHRRQDSYRDSLEMQLLQGPTRKRHNYYDKTETLIWLYDNYSKVWTLFWLGIIYVTIWAGIWVHDVRGFTERYREKQEARISKLESLRGELDLMTKFTGTTTGLLDNITPTAVATTATSMTAAAGATPTL
ncbi:hypothetical protein Dda_1617 [Drechslerella dactyloides]|uniref:Uncharacterized protein n=1 Tax=Drechslerella dactyloides TaxID=74499 RepID=A0AAD6J286_DREDA|nr:hypothetical protein Dda_1617 [Drechslerella dactyloides]